MFMLLLQFSKSFVFCQLLSFRLLHSFTSSFSLFIFLFVYIRIYTPARQPERARVSARAVCGGGIYLVMRRNEEEDMGDSHHVRNEEEGVGESHVGNEEEGMSSLSFFVISLVGNRKHTTP